MRLSTVPEGRVERSVGQNADQQEVIEGGWGGIREEACNEQLVIWANCDAPCLRPVRVAVRQREQTICTERRIECSVRSEQCHNGSGTLTALVAIAASSDTPIGKHVQSPHEFDIGSAHIEDHGAACTESRVEDPVRIEARQDPIRGAVGVHTIAACDDRTIRVDVHAQASAERSASIGGTVRSETRIGHTFGIEPCAYDTALSILAY